jgi:hypothetical protein
MHPVLGTRFAIAATPSDGSNETNPTQFSPQSGSVVLSPDAEKTASKTLVSFAA